MSRLTAFMSELQEAERILARRDRHLKKLIERHGPCGIRPHTRYFETLIRSVISQQLSTKAADTIYQRFQLLYAPVRFPTPEQILATPNETLRAVGMSNSKVSFVKDLVARTQDGTVKFNRLSRMSNEEVIEMLTQVKGIGVWTVHMFLIFSLGRLDVWPVGDLGIRKAVQIACQLDEMPDAGQMEQIAQDRQWRPYCSVVSWFLWRSLSVKE